MVNIDELKALVAQREELKKDLKAVTALIDESQYELSTLWKEYLRIKGSLDLDVNTEYSRHIIDYNRGIIIYDYLDFSFSTKDLAIYRIVINIDAKDTERADRILEKLREVVEPDFLSFVADRNEWLREYYNL